jgi:hypothetical protein
MPPHPGFHRRLRLVAVAVLAGLAIGFITLLTTSQGLRTVRGGRIGGDFPAFYGAARIVRSGETPSLYDPQTQENAERDLFPSGIQGRLPFPYPPFVALAYVPFTWVPFKWAYAAHVVIMACCVLAALAIMRSSMPALRSDALILAAATLSFFPIFRALFGGQNTPLSLLCAAAAAASAARGRDLAAGVWTGVWLFKPQLALFVAVVLLLRVTDRRRYLIGLALIASVYYVVGSVQAGWAWPLWWLQHGAVAFALEDVKVDRGNGISFVWLATEVGISPLGWVAAIATAALALWTTWRKRLDAFPAAGVGAGAATLISPYALYYDGGLSALALITSVATRPSTLAAVAGIWLLAWLQPLRAWLPLPPMTVVVLLSVWLVSTVGSRHAGVMSGPR